MRYLNFCCAGKTQRGAVSVIVAVLLLAVIGIALAVALQSASSNFSDVSAQSDSLDALYLAESGIERALSRASASIPCASLARDPASGAWSLGRGTFIIQSASSPSGNLCDIVVGGYAGLATRNFRARIRYNPGMPLNEPFLSLADFNTRWATQVLISANGLSRFDPSNCANPPCVNTVVGSGTFYAVTDLNNPGSVLEGYRESQLIIPFATGSTATTVGFSIGYTKFATSGNPLSAVVAIDLKDSAQAIVDRIWTDPAKSAPWTYLNASVLTLPANRVYDKVQIYFNLAERPQGAAKRQVILQVDDIRIERIGANASIVTWQELYP